ncbi:MAG TPA: hypothetical protein VL400_17930 [Polyangiaceae bacterium]|nr:hypothetical protein [Polyangiaceae bacterium]
MTPLRGTERARIVEALGVGLVLFACVGAVVVGTHHARLPDAEASCARMLDRYVELRERAADPKSTPAQIASAQVEARVAAARRGDTARCEERLSPETEACASRANTDSELEQCFP